MKAEAEVMSELICGRCKSELITHLELFAALKDLAKSCRNRKGNLTSPYYAVLENAEAVISIIDRKLANDFQGAEMKAEAEPMPELICGRCKSALITHIVTTDVLFEYACNECAAEAARLGFIVDNLESLAGM